MIHIDEILKESNQLRMCLRELQEPVAEGRLIFSILPGYWKHERLQTQTATIGIQPTNQPNQVQISQLNK